MDLSHFITEQHQAVSNGQILMVICPAILLILLIGVMAMAGYTVKKGKMPKALEVLRDVRQPIRNHRHYHYSARTSVQPLSSEEVEQYDVTSLNG
jgi:hypothetical protein